MLISYAIFRTVYIASQNYPHTPDGMRQCRQDLLKNDDPLLKQIVNSWAFYSMSNFRDLAFHTHEICINLNELKELLNKLSLEFLGFSHQYPETIPLYPEDKNMLSLENWDAFEQKHPTTFENCYKFWCRPITHNAQ